MTDAKDILHTYKGGGHHPRFGKGQVFGEITVSDGTIAFSTHDAHVVIPLNGLMLRRGGADNRMIFLTHPDVPDWTLHTADRAFLKDGYLSDHPDTTVLIHTFQKKANLVWKIMIVGVLLIIAGIFGIFKLKEPLLIWTAGRIPPEWEEKLGQAAIDQLKNTGIFVNNPAVKQELGRITDMILTRIPDADTSFKVYLIKDEVVNAYALPGGHIVLNTGLIHAAASCEELAGVLAHEAAHITLQHNLRRMIGQAGIYIMIRIIFGDTGGLTGFITENSAFLLTRKYSRDYEREADQKAWDYLIHAHINPNGLITFLKTLGKNEKKAGRVTEYAKDAITYLSTHPAASERIEYLDKRWHNLKKRSGFIQFDIDFEKFKEMLTTQP